MAAASKRQRCDTELRLGGCTADDASSPCARENKKAAAAAAAAGTHDGDRWLLQLQQLLAASGSGRGCYVTDTEVQALAIIRMARRAAGARPSDRGAARRRSSLRWFLQRRREARSGRGGGGGGSSPSSASCS